MKILSKNNEVKQSSKAKESFRSQVNKLNKVSKPSTNNDSKLQRHARGEAELTFVPKRKKELINQSIMMMMMRRRMKERKR